MLNDNAEKLLQVVLRECDSGYRVLTKDDFSDIPDYADIINELSALGYLSLRFSDGEEFLLCPSYKARNYYDEKQKNYFFHAVLCKKAAIYAFFGGLCGGVVATIVNLIGGLFS